MFLMRVFHLPDKYVPLRKMSFSSVAMSQKVPVFLNRKLMTRLIPDLIIPEPQANPLALK